MACACKYIQGTDPATTILNSSSTPPGAQHVFAVAGKAQVIGVTLDGG